MTLPINTHIRTTDGFDGMVISNSDQSFYGYCPESMVIVRLPGGVTLRAISECIPTEEL